MADAAAPSSSSSCTQPGRLNFLDSGVRSFLATLATHILAGEVDTIFPDNLNTLTTTTAAGAGFITIANRTARSFLTSATGTSQKLSWLLLYFNPVNLFWRYYSMLAFRLTAPAWGPKQLALINFEAHPFDPPSPYVRSDLCAPPFAIKRLEISGFLSSQGLLSFLAAYQGLSAIYFSLSPVLACLPTISKPLAILGLFRVIVSKWVASKVYVEPYPYPSTPFAHLPYPSSKLQQAWTFCCLCIIMLSISPILSHSEVLPLSKHSYVNFMVCTLYQYTGISMFLFHIASHFQYGPLGLANRIPYFDHSTYKVQTWGFVFLLFATFIAGIVDFLKFESIDMLIECSFSS